MNECPRAALVEQINAAPEPLRGYVHELETRADPAGDVRRLVFAELERDALRRELSEERAVVAVLTDQVSRFRVEVWQAHVPVTGTQHDPANGLLHGCCARCRTPWPCEWSPEAALRPGAPAASADPSGGADEGTLTP